MGEAKILGRENRKSYHKTYRYLAAFSLATLIFIGGILLGSAIAKSREKNYKAVEAELQLKLLELEIQKFVMSNDCHTSNYIIEKLGEEISDLGGDLIILESSLGKTNKKVLELKKSYALLQLKHYFTFRERIERCNEDYNQILFFYTNFEPDYKISEQQGFILDYIYKSSEKKNIHIYAIESNLDLTTIQLLKQKYDIKRIPAIVINDKTVIQGFTETDGIKKYLT